MAKKKVDKAAARRYVDIGLWRLGEQNRSIESIERKIASSIAVWGALAVLFFTVVAIADRPGTAGSTSPASCWEWLLVGAIAVIFLGAAGCAAMGYRTRDWKMGPGLDALRENVESCDEPELLMLIGQSVEESHGINEGNIIKKGRWCNGSMYLSLCALALIIVFALVFRSPV